MATGQLNITPDNSDFYYKDLLGGEVITLTINNGPLSAGNITVKMSMPNRTLELSSPSVASGKTYVLNFVSNETTVGRSIIDISLASGQNANYSVIGKFISQNDAASGTDAAGSPCCGIPLTGKDISIIGEVGPGDELLGIDKNDIYYFQVPPHYDIILNGTSNSSKTDTWVELHDMTVKVLPYFRGLLIKTSSLNVKVYGGDAGGRFYLNIDWENGPQATYHIDVTLREAPDKVAPKLTVDAVPATVKTKAIEITGNMTDDRSMDHVEVSINSGPSTSCVGVSAWKCTVSLFEGQNMIVIIGFDWASNKASSTVTIAYVPQQTGPLGIDIVINSPGQGVTVDKETVNIYGNINRTDPQAIVSCSVDGGMTWILNDMKNGIDWRCSNVPLQKKSNTIIVKVVASDGSQDQASVTIYRDIEEEEGNAIGSPQMALAILVMVIVVAVLLTVNELNADTATVRKDKDNRKAQLDESEE